MGKIKNKEIICLDIDSPRSECIEADPKAITRQTSMEVDSTELTLPSFFDTIPRRERSKRDVKKRYSNTFPRRERSKRGVNKKNPISKQHRKLDSNMFQRYFEDLWRAFSEEKKNSFAYLDCLWFGLYRKRLTKTKVLTWIKSKHIFSRKYVFIPIICWRHWSLLILCHFGESLQSETRTPCMLLLDSLEMTNPKRLEPDIRKFVLDIYKEEGRPENKEAIAKIPLLVPKVPQQKNNEDCGFFVLYFINLFLEGAPENFNIYEGYPYFMNENWFSSEGIESFCKQVAFFCRRMEQG